MGKIIKQWHIKPMLMDYECVVATNGCFDILQIGHKRLLEQARALGDVLIVAVNDDEAVRKLKHAPRPMIPQDERAEILSAFSFVDFVVIFHGSTAESIMATIEPDIYVKGDNCDPEKIPEREVVEKHGGILKLLPITPHVSTGAVISRIGVADEIKHVTFKLFDNIEREFISRKNAIKENIVLSADGRLLRYHANVTQRDGAMYADPQLVIHDVSTRYGLVAAVATG